MKKIIMDKKPRKQKRDYDFAVNAFRVVQEATGQTPDPQEPKSISPEDKHAAAVALGRLGGLKGGKARTEKLSPERRKEIAQRAASARWGKK
jgi:hypothetical protein